jgi:hypothetical protein
MSIQWWWHLSILHTPSLHTHTWTFNFWKVKTNVSSLTIPLDSLTSTFEPTKPLDLTLNQEKFTQSCLCKSPFDLKVMSTFHFVNLKTYWPSKWCILVVKADPLVYLRWHWPFIILVCSLPSQFILTQQHILGFAIGFCDYVLVKKDICN